MTAAGGTERRPTRRGRPGRAVHRPNETAEGPEAEEDDEADGGSEAECSASAVGAAPAAETGREGPAVCQDGYMVSFVGGIAVRSRVLQVRTSTQKAAGDDTSFCLHSFSSTEQGNVEIRILVVPDSGAFNKESSGEKKILLK